MLLEPFYLQKAPIKGPLPENVICLVNFFATGTVHQYTTIAHNTTALERFAKKGRAL